MDCRICGAKRGTRPFATKKNLCKTCQSDINAKYRQDNASKLKKQRDEYWARQDQGVRWQRVRNAIMRSPESFLRDQLYHIKSHSKKPTACDPKDPIRREFDLDIEYVMGLWVSQDQKCALTSLGMTYKFDDLRAVSIDRIDSAKGHIKGNIQLVCQCVNRMKNDHSNAEIINFLCDYMNNLRVLEAYRIADSINQSQNKGEGHVVTR